MPVHRYGLISDTHGHLHPKVYEAFGGAEAILHAGDVGHPEILGDLAALAPVFAVQGNIDAPAADLPLLRVLDLAFGQAILTHGHLLPSRSPRDLARHFTFRETRL
ncbi:MAG: metallophosphoesterase family protein, partial [Candidatus Sumerlaeota bacterium]|nr:metallophosphoesterase family protein [Candidatus Sumerlaeota bacterium]